MAIRSRRCKCANSSMRCPNRWSVSQSCSSNAATAAASLRKAAVVSARNSATSVCCTAKSSLLICACDASAWPRSSSKSPLRPWTSAANKSRNSFVLCSRRASTSFREDVAAARSARIASNLASSRSSNCRVALSSACLAAPAPLWSSWATSEPISCRQAANFSSSCLAKESQCWRASLSMCRSLATSADAAEASAVRSRSSAWRSPMLLSCCPRHLLSSSSSASCLARRAAVVGASPRSS
mmetsp:Transcript_13547/g.36600  ORF Transcript_13547/g.36600 Transcript_13547/m.36600 type:complete len:241 (-) Transcript_13547:721-1443(-)